MTTDLLAASSHAASIPAELYDGARMDRRAFHELYERTPEKFKAELIGGIVHVALPLGVAHGRTQGLLMGWLFNYATAMPGTDFLDNATVQLANDGEPQPDAVLRLEGGASWVDDDGYVTGPPEFVAEVADSTVTKDLVSKRSDYERGGVAEYLVLVVPERRAVWFVRDERGAFTQMPPDEAGRLKSRAFPGLWLSPEALFGGDGTALLDVLRQRLATDEHARFVAGKQA